MENRKDRAKPDNKQIADYLNFYINRADAPGFAVFLNGPWGSGKTWFIDEFRKSRKDLKFVYVSLYGVSKITEIEDQFFQQLHPFLASKTVSIGTKLVTGLVKGTLGVDLFGDSKKDANLQIQIPKLDVQKFLSDSENCILIFDDLERCSEKDLDAILGYINHFVEHQGQKVILIGHEKKIPKLAEYQKKNEKLVGRSFTLNAELEIALSSFLELVGDQKAKEVLKSNTATILKAYERSSHENLRTLKYSVVEYERFHSQLPPKAQDHPGFQTACLNAFFSICIELKSGAIAVQDIKKLHSQYQTYLVNKAVNKKEDAAEVENPVLAVYEKHFGASLEEIVPNEESHYFFFEYGFIPKDVISDAIESNRYFLEDKSPAWVKLWHIHSLTDEEFEKHSTEVFGDFRAHKFKKQGELRHVAGMLLSFSKQGIIPMSYSDAVAHTSKVIGEMISKRLVESLSSQEEAFPRFDDAYAGLGYSANDDEHFKELSIKLREYQKERKQQDIRAASSTLLPIMKTDSRRFFQMLTVSSSTDPKYYHVPILQYLPPKEFLKTFLEMSPKDNSRLNIGYVFKERYTLINSYPELAEELTWLKQVSAAIDATANGLKQPTKWHLLQFKEHFLGKAIQIVEGWINRKNESQSTE